jgi:hypothetical protein
LGLFLEEERPSVVLEARELVLALRLHVVNVVDVVPRVVVVLQVVIEVDRLLGELASLVSADEANVFSVGV